MNDMSYSFGVTCPKCGAPLVHENASPPMDCGYRSTAILKCNTKPCRTRWQIVVEMIAVSRTPPLPAPIRECA